METDHPLLEVRGVSKRFPGVLALDNVSLLLRRAEVLALIGENGAGKSTLMKILAGEQLPDGGEILLDGKPVHIESVPKAASLGIALIHQELNLADNLDVATNVFLGRERTGFGPARIIDTRRSTEECKELLRRVGLACSPRAIVSTLSPGQQQMVEIAKALSTNARVIIMDEPTSSLTQHEAEVLFALIADLATQGVSVVYISHRLGEVRRVAHRVVVLRDGRNAGELQQEEIDHDRMVKLMVGRDVEQFYVRREHELRDAVLEVRGLRAAGSSPVTFSVRAGEILGLAGLVGAGRSEMARAIFGVDRALEGTVLVEGRHVNIRSARDAIRAGLALVPEDRKQQGLILEMAIRENVSLPGLGRLQRFSLVRRLQERAVAEEMAKRLQVRCTGIEQAAQFLSGGNQQKVVLAKWLALQPKVLLLDEPTRGVDVGAKEEIYRLIEQLAESGVATVMISSELQEILGMCDRVLVMHEGRMAGELQRAELSEEAVMLLATGRTAVTA